MSIIRKKILLLLLCFVSIPNCLSAEHKSVFSVKLFKIELSYRYLVPITINAIIADHLVLGGRTTLEIPEGTKNFYIACNKISVNRGATIIAKGINGKNGKAQKRGKSGGNGCNLYLYFKSGNIKNLSIYTIGGAGGQGGKGRAGRKGKNASCWGSSGGNGSPGGKGSTGGQGGNGGNVYLYTGDKITINNLSVNTSSGAGGAGGEGGAGGAGGAPKRCGTIFNFYTRSGGNPGKDGPLGDIGNCGKKGVYNKLIIKGLSIESLLNREKISLNDIKSFFNTL